MYNIILIISCLLIYLLFCFFISKVFKKAKLKQYKAYIPIYNTIKLLNLADLKWYYIILLLITPINIWFYIYLNIKLGKKFNKGTGFIVGMILLPIVFYAILGFDNSSYDAKTELKSKTLNFLSILVCVLSILLVSILLIPKVFTSITKGLDLAGGFEILYQISSAEEGKKITEEDVENTYRTMLRRIDKLGVSEPEIIIEGKDKIRVKLAGVTNPDEARDYITVAGELTFRDSNDNKLMDKSVLADSGAKISQDKNGNPAILLNIKDKDKFYEVTSNISKTDDKLIVIWLDYDSSLGDSYKTSKNECGNFENINETKCLSAATVSEGFSSNVIIQGNFTSEQVKTLVDLINSGSTNVKFKEISSKTVGSEFGFDSLNKTQIAGIIGILLIVIFMILIYRFSGLVASISIILYTLCVFTIFYLIEGVLTLPGIAALVLGIGMAIDACVITSERIKEELNKGRSLKTAFINGNKQSFSSIFDSNITTLIVAIILFAFGESSVKGFATMLIINIIMTMFIIIYINRLIMKLFVNTDFFDDKLKLFVNYSDKKLNKTNKFDFVKHFKKFVSLSGLIFIIGIIMMITTGFNFGIDFSGGSDISIISSDKLSQDKIKKDIKNMNYNIIDITKADDNTVYVKIDKVLDENEVKSTAKYLEDKYNSKTEISVVSNVVKKDLIKNAIISLLFAIIGIIMYISLRYKFSFAISSVLALIHDVLIIICLFSIFKIEINSIFVAAILTIIGYSLNNTIVIFDRIRENIGKNKKLDKEELKTIVNNSVSETLNRSINTTITTMLPVITLIILGAKEILEFDIAILIGLVAGAYSSIFLSSQIWMIIEHNSSKKEKKKTKPKKSPKKPDELIVKGINS